MKAEHEPETIRRILVALDNSRHSLAALEAAAALAECLQAELSGLFVEDINLIRLAGLPFAQEIHYPSASLRQLSRQRLEQELKARATQARQALAVAAAQANVAWSFRVVRGLVTAELLAAASDVDLLSLGIASQPSTRHRVRLGSTARLMAAAQSPQAVLLSQHGQKIAQPFIVTYNGTLTAQRALAMAVHLTEKVAPATSPAIIVLTIEKDTTTTVEDEVAAWLESRQVRVNFHRLAKADVGSLSQVVQATKAGLLILNGERFLSQPETIQSLVDKIACPILLIK